ncbi:response regulator [Shewanella sp. GXUN23E]
MRYRFDHFVLDTRTQSLSYQGRMLNCDERILNLLLLLIEHAPEYVDKQTLLDTLWPDTVVSDWSISRLISDTRKLLKSAGADFPVIQTLHGRGYRLSAEVLSILKSESVSQPVSTPAAPAKRIHRLWPVALIIILLLALTSRLFLATDATDSLNLAEPREIKARVLWVDDHPENNLAEREYLQRQGMAVYTAANTSDALMLLAMYHYDVVISDMGRQDEPLAGMKLVDQMRRSGNETPYLLYTIVPSEAQQQLVHKHGAQGVAVDQDELYELLAQYIPLSPQR